MRRSFVAKFRVIRTNFRFDEAKLRFGKTKYRLDEKKFRFHETKFRLAERNFVFQEFVADYRIAVIITSCKSTGRGIGEPGRPLTFRPKWGPKDRKQFFWRTPPPLYLRVWMTAPTPLIWRSGSATDINQFHLWNNSMFLESQTVCFFFYSVHFSLLGFFYSYIFSLGMLGKLFYCV